MWQKFELYIVSLFLLFLLLFLNKVPYCIFGDCSFVGWKSLFTDHIVVVFSIFCMLLAVFFYLRFDYQVIQGASNLPVQITKLENYNFEAVTFLATYIVPLVCFDLDFDLDKGRNFFMLFCVLFLIGWIYIKTNLFYTNPTLAVMGFHIYKIDTLTQENVIVIVKRPVVKGDWLYCKPISDNIFYAKLKL